MEYRIDIIQEKHHSDIIALSRTLFNKEEAFHKGDEIGNGFVILFQEKVIAYLTFALIEFDIPHFIVMSLGVSESHQNKKLASLLLQECKKYFSHYYTYLHQRYNVEKKIYLQVRTQNQKAIRVYQREEFVYFETLSNYYKNPQEDAFHMVYIFSS